MYKILPIVILFFTGCAIPWAKKPIVDPSKTAPTINESKDIKEQKNIIKQTQVSGYIKGVIQRIEWDENQGLWVYEVAGSDTKNGKLPQAKFTYDQKLFAPGAFIYAQIKDDKLVEMYKVSGNQLLPPKLTAPASIKNEKKPIQKRTKERQKILPPETETILLD